MIQVALKNYIQKQLNLVIFRSKSIVLKNLFVIIFTLFLSVNAYASYILIPMDSETQKNHLKAYGVTYWTLEEN